MIHYICKLLRRSVRTDSCGIIIAGGDINVRGFRGLPIPTNSYHHDMNCPKHVMTQNS